MPFYKYSLYSPTAKYIKKEKILLLTYSTLTIIQTQHIPSLILHFAEPTPKRYITFGTDSSGLERLTIMYEAIQKNPLKITSLNHISVACKSVEKSVEFYSSVLGFFLIKRPGSFDFDGAWLFNYGIGIHLIQSENPINLSKTDSINPKDNHISFQCDSMEAVEAKLTQMKIKYVKGRVEEGGIQIDQVFFHDPDGTMIEICNCNVLPVVPLVALNQAIIRSHPHAYLIIESQQQQAYPIMTRTPSFVAIRL